MRLDRKNGPFVPGRAIARCVAGLMAGASAFAVVAATAAVTHAVSSTPNAAEPGDSIAIPEEAVVDVKALWPVKLASPEIEFAKRFLFWGSLGAALMLILSLAAKRAHGAVDRASAVTAATALRARSSAQNHASAVATTASASVRSGARQLAQKAAAFLMFILAAIVCGAAVMVEGISRAIAERLQDSDGRRISDVVSTSVRM
ncbi:MAG: hypothetical protein AAFX08_08405 [Pseudomonadota bacterium]